MELETRSEELERLRENQRRADRRIKVAQERGDTIQIEIAERDSRLRRERIAELEAQAPVPTEEELDRAAEIFKLSKGAALSVTFESGAEVTQAMAAGRGLLGEIRGALRAKVEENRRAKGTTNV